MAKIKNSKDILILLLAAEGPSESFEPVYGVTRLMKMLFLFNKEIYKDFNSSKSVTSAALPTFVAYDYGPFSNQLYIDIDFLTSIEIVADSLQPVDTIGDGLDSEIDPDDDKKDSTQTIRVFSLSKMGREYYLEKLKPQLTEAQVKLLREFKIRCLTVPLKTLLRYVYQKYPEMTVNSKIKQTILGSH